MQRHIEVTLARHRRRELRVGRWFPPRNVRLCPAAVMHLLAPMQVVQFNHGPTIVLRHMAVI